MKHLIIDCFQHYPSLYYIIDADYCVLVPKHDINEFNAKYKFKYNTNVVGEKYNCLFIVMPLLNISKLHEPVRWNYFYNMLNETISKYRNLINNKVVIIDNHDYDILPDKDILSTIDYDIILKRNFSCAFDYNDIIEISTKKIYPFPYVDCTCNLDPIYLLKTYKLTNVEKINRVFWIGSEYKHIDNVFGRENNRKELLDNIRDYLYTPKSKLPHNEFMNEISKSKYALSLAGCSSWGTRHFEIMAANTLMLFQIGGCIPPPKNHVFPFPMEFSSHCMFTSDVDFKNKLKNLQENDDLYLECLNIQNEIKRKYFSFEFIKKYIDAKIS